MEGDNDSDDDVVVPTVIYTDCNGRTLAWEYLTIYHCNAMETRDCAINITNRATFCQNSAVGPKYSPGKRGKRLI